MKNQWHNMYDFKVYAFPEGSSIPGSRLDRPVVPEDLRAPPAAASRLRDESAGLCGGAVPA